MADRQKFCIAIISLLTLSSASYLAYYLFLHPSKSTIDHHNLIRFYIFLSQHLFTLAMMLRELAYQTQDHDRVIKWIFQLSLVIVLTFIAGEVFIVTTGGRLFGDRLGDFDNLDNANQDIIEFQINQATLYFQCMTDFVIFFIVSAIAMAIFKYRAIDTEQRYEFMIDNLKSQDFVDQPNTTDKKSCAICLTDLEGERVLKLPCDHLFHKECLINWLKRSSVCPMCRNDIQESLSPTSPHRHTQISRNFHPQINSQPIILPPPSIPNSQSNRAIISPRQIVPLNINRNQASVQRNQNQISRVRMGHFDQNETRSQNLQNLTFQQEANQINQGQIPEFRQFQGPRNNGQSRGIFSERESATRNIKSSMTGTVTDRRIQNEFLQNRPISSHMTRDQRLG